MGDYRCTAVRGSRIGARGAGCLDGAVVMGFDGVDGWGCLARFVEG